MLGTPPGPDAGPPDAAGLDAPAPFDRPPADVVPAGAAPRLLRPLSATHTTRGAPTLRWAMPAGATRARVLVCRDRTCGRVVHDLAVNGDRVTVPALEPRAHFWRVEVDGRTSPTWSFWPSPRGAPVDGSFGQVADFNNDGAPDLALVTAGAVDVYFGRNPGFGDRPNQTLRPAAEVYCAAALAGDLDGDGFVDLLAHRCTPDERPGGWEILRGSPNGLQPGTRLDLPDRAKVVGVGDLDGDGLGDLAATGTNAMSPPYLRLVLGDGRTMDRDRPPGVPPLSSALPAAVWDVDGDGLDDVGVGVYGTNDGAWVLRDGASTSPRWSHLGPRPEPSGRNAVIRTVFGGDVNGDGISDVLVSTTLYDNAARRYELYVELHPGGPGGPVAGSSQLVLRPQREDSPPRSVLVTDVDGNGLWDVFVSARYDSGAGVQSRVLRFLGSHVGLSPTGSSLVTDPPGSSSPMLFVLGLGDLDGDGVRDVGVLGPRGAGEAGVVLRAYAGGATDGPVLRTWTLVTAPSSWFEATAVGSN